jgi:uncharacterized protein (DUF1697 family)
MPTMSHVALMRGINVGGKNKLPMKELAGYFADAGCSDVRTYIQSGNVIFRAGNPVLKGLTGQITERIATEFGYKVPDVLRSEEELSDAIANNPFLKPDADENAHYMMFLGDIPAAEAIARLDAGRSPGDEFHVRGRDVYLYLRTGAADTRLTNAWFDKQLQTVSTARNWRTVLKLQELLGFL